MYFLMQTSATLIKVKLITLVSGLRAHPWLSIITEAKRGLHTEHMEPHGITCLLK